MTAIRRWSLADAWSAAVEVTAAAYGLEPDTLRAESRGRGPRPPKAVWEAKKMAIHLAVVLSDCDYASLGRHLGLHKDTVASHCAAVREACANLDIVEHQVETLAAGATVRLELTGVLPLQAAGAETDRPDHSTPAGRLKALEVYVGKLFANAREALSDDEATVTRPFPKSSDRSRNRELCREIGREPA